jgi:hypothetical protein
MNLMEEASALSAYHFDPTRIDPRFDGVAGLGQFSGDWADEVATAISIAKPVSMSTRSSQTSGVGEGQTPFKHDTLKYYNFEKEYFDPTDLDYDRYPIISKTDIIGPKMTKMVEAFKLEGPLSYTCHVQFTGQVFPYHIDFFHRRNNYVNIPPEKIARYMIMLTDWEPGHMFGYGNFQYTGWKAGDFSTLLHAHTPHYSANGAYNPRVMLLITGVKTKETEEFLWQAANNKTIRVDDLK